MARLPRLYAPHVPQLAQAMFVRPFSNTESDACAGTLDLLLSWLKQDAVACQVALHGWLLTQDRITLLATPPDDAALPKLMQALGRRIAARLRHGRVYAGRYRSALLEPGQWLLPALLWLETEPVRIRLADAAEHWPWSSARCHAGLDARHQDILHDHVDYWMCGNTPFERQNNYRAMLREGLPPAQEQAISQALQGQWALGGERFLAQLSLQASRRARPAPRGRPRKTASGAQD